MEKTEKFKNFLEMSKKQFDDYMCKTYPSQFDQRNLTMDKTCMRWGFCVGSGWYYYLDEMCSQLDLIQKVTGIRVSFTQIKEKYASGRFYHIIKKTDDILKDENIINIWCKLIDTIISQYEEFVGHICEKTGKHICDPIVIGSWHYSLSEGGFLLEYPERAEQLEKFKKSEKYKEKIEDMLAFCNDEEYDSIMKYMEKILENKKKS